MNNYFYGTPLESWFCVRKAGENFNETYRVIKQILSSSLWEASTGRLTSNTLQYTNPRVLLVFASDRVYVRLWKQFLFRHT